MVQPLVSTVRSGSSTTESALIWFCAVLLSAALLGAFAVSPGFAQPSPQVTSEIPCDPAVRFENPTCPNGVCLRKRGDCPIQCIDFLNEPNFFVTAVNAICNVTCSSVVGRCQPFQAACGSSDDCFGSEVCLSGLCTEAFCDDDGTCTEVERIDTPCNADTDCAPWRSCRLGVCALNECTINGDCAGDRVCAAGSCVDPPECRIDDDCRGDEVCRTGDCVRVQCRETADCGACELCTENRCVSVCGSGETCRGFYGGAGGRPGVEFRCEERSTVYRCTSDVACPIGQRCLGGVCRDPASLLPVRPDLGDRPPLRFECRDHGDCKLGQLCVRGRCSE